MTCEELQQKISDVEAMVDMRYREAVKAYHKYVEDCLDNGKVIVKTEPQRSQFFHLASKSIDRLKLDFAMQESPADVGDIIESDLYLMRVERIEVTSSDYPKLLYYGKYLKRNLEPRDRQIFKPIHQADILRVVKVSNQKKHY
jgi:hypothetical protein